MVKLDCILRMRYNIAHGLVTAAQNSPNALKSSQKGMPWREAASVMLVSPKPLKQTDCSTTSSTGNSSTAKSQGKAESKPHFLVTNRSNTGSFSSITCFPGGNVCNADQKEKWVDILGVIALQDISKGVTFIKDGGELPSIYHVARDKDPDKLTYQDFEQKRVPKNISLRITAIRETFEETGILLCKMGDIKKFGKLGQDSASVGCEATVHNFEDPDEVTYWQERVKNDPGEFMAMCEELICYPDVNALVEWSDWLTPNCFGMQRYDTIFYMALLPQPYPLQICPKEVDSASWVSAEQVLKDCEERKCKMITPQIYELARLRSASIKTISQLMKIRLKLGIERWCSAYIRAKDGYLSVLPGDDLYPEAMRIELFEPIPSIDSTLDELRDTTIRHHRIEYRSEFDFRVVINNYRERAGHIYLDI